jgi:hypothetical protein
LFDCRQGLASDYTRYSCLYTFYVDWGRTGSAYADGTVASCETQAKALMACLNGTDPKSCDDNPASDACGKKNLATKS